MSDVKKTLHIAWSVGRQIEDVVCAVVVLAYLVARRREECHEYLVIEILLAYLLNDGATLLKLAKRSDVYPHHLIFGFDALLHPLKDVFASLVP